MINTNKAQSWSIDIALGVIIFIAGFFIFYVLLNTNANTKVSTLKEDASIVSRQVTAEGSVIRVIDGNEINISKLNELKNISYEELKRKLKIESDFCIYFENEEGRLVLINNSYKGVGASSINLSGTPCSQK